MPHCDACTELAAKMDHWGQEKCLEKFGEIVADILPRAQAWIKSNHPVAQKILAFTHTEQLTLVTAISQNVKKAIKLSRRSP
jgi:hypothetical protein